MLWYKRKIIQVLNRSLKGPIVPAVWYSVQVISNHTDFELPMLSASVTPKVHKA